LQPLTSIDYPHFLKVPKRKVRMQAILGGVEAMRETEGNEGMQASSPFIGSYLVIADPVRSDSLRFPLILLSGLSIPTR
jgi:hypothetical protein